MPGARFIVTTGRCGSTLLSNLLREHPSVLSLSELFSSLHSLQVSAFPDGEVTGAETWRILTTPRPEVNQLMEGCEDGEALAAQGLEPGSIPPLLMGTLRDLSPDPVALHEELGDFVRALPDAPVGVQYSRLLEWLCARLGREVWVERSGGSTWFLDQLVRCWPDGRYVHLVRDGRAAAYSMSWNEGFRMAALLRELGDGAADPALAAGAIARLDTAEIPIERFGALWTEQVVAADGLLRTLPADQLLVLRYEDLLEDAERELGRLVAFLGLPGEASERWAREMAIWVGGPRRDWRDLPEAERRRLSEACEPGLRQLAYRP